ncbi:MAG: LysR family transcriptional regulator [Oceanicaulis sp.]
MLSLKSARLFVAAAERGTVSAGAQAIAVSQPAATKILAQLEASLGGALFERTGRRLALTALGAALLPRARTLVQTAADLEGEARRWRTGGAGALSIGVGPSVEYSFLPGAVARLYQTGRDIALTVRAGPAARLIEQLRGGELDLVAADIGAVEGPDDLTLMALPEEGVAACVREGHALLDAGGDGGGDGDPGRYPVASATPPGRLARGPMPFGLAPASLVCDDYVTLARACAASDHVLVGPQTVIARLCADHALVRLELGGSPVVLRPGLMRRASAPADPALDALCAAFLEASAAR